MKSFRHFFKKTNPKTDAQTSSGIEPVMNHIHKIQPRARIIETGSIGTTKDHGSSEVEKKIMRKTEEEISDRRIYADYASLTPMDARVKKVFVEALDQFTANPSSLYKEGVLAKKALEDARNSVAQFFSVQKDEVVFTSGGTESNNLAFRGIINAWKKSVHEHSEESVAGDKKHAKAHIVISTIEHPSIIELALQLIEEGIDVSFVPVNEKGIIDAKDIRKVLRPETILVSVIYANNEIGTVQPIKEITREVRHYKKSLDRDNGDFPYVHTDACQAVLYEDMRIPGLNIDLVTIDGGKVYGPRGCGALIKKRYVKLAPAMNGGSQEFGLRPGTENIASIIALKHALDIAHSEKDHEVPRLRELQQTLIDLIFAKLNEKVPGIAVNGDMESRLPNNINICFPGLDAEFLVLRLDVLGIAVSSVTSCRANNEDSSSYVIEALGKSDCALSSLRITLGRHTTAADIGFIAEKVAQAVAEQVEK